VGPKISLFLALKLQKLKYFSKLIKIVLHTLEQSAASLFPVSQALSLDTRKLARPKEQRASMFDLSIDYCGWFNGQPTPPPPPTRQTELKTFAIFLASVSLGDDRAAQLQLSGSSNINTAGGLKDAEIKFRSGKPNYNSADNGFSHHLAGSKATALCRPAMSPADYVGFVGPPGCHTRRMH